MKKPRLFIGSTVEKIEIARAIQAEIIYDFEPALWNQGTFAASKYPLESLGDELDRADFGVFIFAPDDETRMRDKTHNTVRDNIIFELGLFVGRLGRERTFIIVPKGVDMHLPSDLDGLTPITYDPEQLTDLRMALGPACSELRTALRQHGPRSKPVVADTAPSQTAPIDEAESPYTSPNSDWKIRDYEFAHFLACTEKNQTLQDVIENSIAQSGLIENEEKKAEWEAKTERNKIEYGDNGSVSNIRQISEKYPKNPILKSILGSTYLHFNNNQGAFDEFKSAFECADDIISASGVLARLIEVADTLGIELDLEKYRAKLRALHKSDHAEKQVFASTMKLIAQARKLDCIERSIDEILMNYEPDKIDNRFSIAYKYGNSDDYDLSLLHYESIPTNKRSGVTWNNLGVAYSHFQMRGLAISGYKKASDQNETLADSNLAYSLIRAGFFDEANERIELALAKKNYHENLIEAHSSLKTARDEEQKILQKTRKTAREKQLFLSRLGEASLEEESFQIEGVWNTQGRPLELVIDKNGQISATVEVEREVKGLGLLFASGTKTVTDKIEYRFSRIGNAFEGKMIRYDDPNSPKGLLSFSPGESRIVLIPSEEENILLGRILNHGAWEELRWERAS